MLVIPLRFTEKIGDRGPLVLVVILQKDNLDRMAQADPVDIQINKFLPYLPVNGLITDLDIVIAREDDLSKLLEFQKTQDARALMQWLERGRRILAGDGEPPVPLRSSAP